MTRQLGELTNEQLITIIQDYQDMVSDIEDILNKSRIVSDTGRMVKVADIREALLKDRSTIE